MEKAGSIYTCIECGLETPKWMGKCLGCGSWGSLMRVEARKERRGKLRKRRGATIERIGTAKNKKYPRLKTGFAELDRALGGGVVSGEVILIGGEPGVGKTSLLLQLLNNIIHSSKKECIYVSAEESLEQITQHSKRLSLSQDLGVICDNDIDSILSALGRKKLSLVVIDSIQTVKTDDLQGLPGGVGQVRECAARVVEYAKKNKVAVVLIGHITKGGDLAGPKVLEHIVDAVFYLEGEVASNTRLLRGLKNRFGSTNEIGVLRFRKDGFSDAKNPSEIFILSKDSRVGVCKGAIFEGRRIIIIEIQALISKSAFNLPQRIVRGLKKAKIQMLCALLSKYSKVDLLDKDVYVNVASGLNVDDSSLDLCICVALLSSYLNKNVSPRRIAIGEVSLTGQVHATGMLSEKLKALKRLGYSDFMIPKEAAKASRRKTKHIDSVFSFPSFL